MKKIIVIGAFLFSIINYAQTKESEPLDFSKTIAVTINDIISDNGKVYFALYNNAEDFKNRKNIAALASEIEDGKVTVSFTNVKSGEYAIVCYHDSNNNQKLDFQQNGMPLEDYGMSNNRIMYGPPNFEDAKFEVLESDITLEIKF